MNKSEEKKENSKQWLTVFETLDKSGQYIIAMTMDALLARQQMEEEQKEAG